MILTRRKFILASGSALAGAVFVPKFERWFKTLNQTPVAEWAGVLGSPQISFDKHGFTFQFTDEMILDDVYGRDIGVYYEQQDGSSLYLRRND